VFFCVFLFLTTSLVKVLNGCDKLPLDPHSDWRFRGRLLSETGSDMNVSRCGDWRWSDYDELEFYDINGDLVWQPFSNSEALDVCIGLQDLELPALVTLKIIDALFPKNGVRCITTTTMTACSWHPTRNLTTCFDLLHRCFG
jgi:hypothetical protein